MISETVNLTLCFSLSAQVQNIHSPMLGTDLSSKHIFPKYGAPWGKKSTFVTMYCLCSCYDLLASLEGLLPGHKGLLGLGNQEKSKRKKINNSPELNEENNEIVKDCI